MQRAEVMSLDGLGEVTEELNGAHSMLPNDTIRNLPRAPGHPRCVRVVADLHA